MRRVKTKTVHGTRYVIAVDKEGNYFIFTAEEYSCGEGLRYPEWEAGSMKECLEFLA